MATREMSVAAEREAVACPLVVNAVTVWAGRPGHRIEFDREAPESGWDEVRAVYGQSSVVWVDMEWDIDPILWKDPWDAADGLGVDWSHFGRGVGKLAPPGDLLGRGGGSPLACVLSRLPRVNELGEQHWLETELRQLGTAAEVLPLAGFRPTEKWPGRRAPEPAEFLLLRVNMAVHDPFVLTVRLPDRLCTGRGDAQRRIDARDYSDERPPVADPDQYLGPGDQPSATDVGAAVALYLSATCGCVAEYARRELVKVDREVSALLEQNVEDNDDVQAIEDVGNQYKLIYKTRGALKMAEEELIRLLDRQFDAEISQSDARARIRGRYERALDDIRSAESQLRVTGDALTHRIETMRVAQAQRRERQAAKGQALLAVMGTVFVIATLIASLFQDRYKLPHPSSAPGAWGMLLIMLGCVLVVLSALAAGRMLYRWLRTPAMWLGAPLGVALCFYGVLLVERAH